MFKHSQRCGGCDFYRKTVPKASSGDGKTRSLIVGCQVAGMIKIGDVQLPNKDVCDPMSIGNTSYVSSQVGRSSGANPYMHQCRQLKK